MLRSYTPQYSCTTHAPRDYGYGCLTRQPLRPSGEVDHVTRVTSPEFVLVLVDRWSLLPPRRPVLLCRLRHHLSFLIPSHL